MGTQDSGANTAEGGTALTAYASDEAMLRRRLANGTVDTRSFQRRVSRCEISRCQGMCCYDGVYVSEESAAVITSLAERHADFFTTLGLDLPKRVIVEGEWQGKRGGLKTAVRARDFSATVEGYPAHFEDTACVFLARDGRCALQLLSEHEGRHPWHYKPVKCWLHPITIEGDGQSALVLHSRETDPYRLPGYDGFVSTIFCGRTCPGGAPASTVLAKELAFLSRIVGRGLLGEIERGSASRTSPPAEVQGRPGADRAPRRPPDRL